MMYHLKPLFIRAKVDNMAVNKVFVHGGSNVNLMSHSLFKKMGKIDVDLRPHNMALSIYEGKTGHILGVIQVKLSVGSTTIPTLFMVIVSNANYNLLLGREWIHGISEVPSMLHQRASIWLEYGILENIEVDQSYYMVKVNKVGKKHFDRNLAKIPPCYVAEDVYTPQKDVAYFLNLQPNHCFN